MSLLDTASLIVTPNAYKEGKLYSVIPSDGSGDMSVVRATTATRVNSAGLVELVPYNLLSYSEQFDNAAWDKLNATITANAIAAPDGTLTADALVAANTTSAHILFVSTGLTASSLTTTIYAKKGTSNFIQLTGNGETTVFANFDLNAGITGTSSGCTSSITSAGNGWYRLRVSYTPNTLLGSAPVLYLTTSASAVRGESWAAAGTEFVYLWGAQLNEGTIKPYQKTETRLNIPRLDYSNGTCPSLLVEPQRTNVLQRSQEFENAYWTKSASTITANNTTAPNGTLTADKLVENSSIGEHAIARVAAMSAAGVYAFSVYAKAAERTRIAIGNSSAGHYAIFDLSTGTVVQSSQGTVTNGQISSIDANGFYRVCCIITVTSAASSVINLVSTGTTINYTGDGTSGLFIWGAQLEAGSYPTSYIPTTSASVTRNADVISKTGISSLIGQTEGTIFFEGVIYGENPSVNRRILSISNGTTATAINIQTPVLNSKLEFEVTNGGATQVFISAANNSLVYGQNFKAAFAYKANDFVAYINGVQIGTDTNGTVPTCDKLSFDRGNNTSNFEGSAKAAALWKTRLTNDELATLTTI
jgi:hypothetical protein